MVRKSMAVVAAALVAALVVARCGDPQSPSESPVLAGTVVDAQGTPVHGAQLGIVYRFGSAPQPGVAGDDIPAPPPGPTHLYPNAPNPFDGVTILMFALVDSPVRLSILARDRRLVRQLVDRALPQGLHSVAWDRRDDAGQAVPQGVYIARLEAGAPGAVQAQEIRMFYSTPDRDELYALATTDRDGHFSLSLASLPIGEAVTGIDIDHTPVGSQIVLNTIELCATGAGGLRTCREIDLGDLRRNVSVTLQLP